MFLTEEKTFSRLDQDSNPGLYLCALALFQLHSKFGFETNLLVGHMLLIYEKKILAWARIQTQVSSSLIKIMPTLVFPLSWSNDISAGPEVSRDQLREKFWLCPVIGLGGAVRSAPAHRTRDLDSNPGPGEKKS